MRKALLITIALVLGISASAKDHEGITSTSHGKDYFTLIENGIPISIIYDNKDYEGVQIAAHNLRKDFGRVCGTEPPFGIAFSRSMQKQNAIIVGSVDSKLIQDLVTDGKLDVSSINGKRETYLITTVTDPQRFVQEALVIVGSDKRGTIYGIYELSEQIGVSPWYDWADVPAEHHDDLSIKRGVWTVDEPAVTYRGIFLNDEAPCLTSWVRNTYGTNYGGHDFYARVFELILRLRGNYLWPAMWSWSFSLLTVRQRTIWASLWEHHTMSLWHAIIKNGQDVEALMVHGTTRPIKRRWTNFSARAYSVPRTPRTSLP